MQQLEVDHGGHLGPVLRRFPEHEDVIRELSRCDQEFGELCVDYGECVAALGRFRDQGAGAIGRVEEYTELRVGLEHELLTGIARRQEALRNPHLRREE